MLSKTSGVLALVLLTWAGLARFRCVAQSAQAPAEIRFHLGDDARWTDPQFDDSAWTVAKEGLLPSRSRDTDRFL